MRIGGPGYKKEGGGSAEESSSSTGNDARLEAARALIKAVERGDAEAADEAMYSHHKACKAERSEPAEDDDE